MTDYLSMAREAYTTSTTFFDASIRGQIEGNLRQFQGVHPNGSKYHSDTYRARSRLFRPKTRTTIRKNEATAAEALFSTTDVVSVKPSDESNEIQQISAEVMQGLVAHRLKKSIPWFLTAIGAYQDAQTVGVCISHQDWVFDEKKKIDKPVIELMPIENMRIDPGSNWADPINSSPYVIRMIPMYVKDVKARTTRIDTKTGSPKWLPVDDATLLSAVNGYSDTTRLTRERGRTDSKEQSQAIRDFAIVWVHQNIIEVDGEDMLYYTLGTLSMLSNPVPLSQVYFHGKRPFVMGCCILETHKTYPGGVAEITKDTQAEINEIANQRIDNVKFAMNKRYFVRRSKQVDIRSLTRNVPGSVTMLTDLDDVKVQETNDVTSSSYQEQDRLNSDFDDVAGTFSQSSVASNRKLNETVGGMNLLTTNANQVSSYQLRTFVETWVEPVLEQLVLLEQHYETDVTILAMAGKNAGLMQKFGTDEVTDEMLMQELTTRVNVGIGSTNPKDQINSFMMGMTNLRNILADGLLEKYGMNVQEVIKELFGKLGYADGSRFFNVEQEDPALTNAKAMIEQLQQEIAQKTSPELVAKQIEKIDAEISKIKAESVQTGVSSAFSATQAAASIAQMPQISPVADAVLAMAGYQTPNPVGIDPNLPQPQAAPVEHVPVAQDNTSPQFPPIPQQPESAMQGIETSQVEPV
ncbi:hypothetical protein [Acidithiobacillus sp.]|uniref:portal protein n=1 Tax=Acidithiobacillus sp. TaxID=1872118 RepID=UPI00258CDA82|nr:hypothetical protein [Acidithiobacillus sp.]MDD5375286.1 hypothetical protein [Acidithiobacillus sp.]